MIARSTGNGCAFSLFQQIICVWRKSFSETRLICGARLPPA
jgi:hypothetical protein